MAWPFHDQRELPAEVEGVLHAAVHALSAGRRMHVGGVAGQKHVAQAKRVGQTLPGFPFGMPNDVPECDAIVVLVEQPPECLLRREIGIVSFAPVAQEQAKMPARQRRHHQEMVRADAVVKMIRPVVETVEEDVEVLERTPLVVFLAEREAETLTDARVDAVAGDQIPAPDHLFRVTSIGMDDPRAHLVTVLVKTGEAGVVFDRGAELGTGKVPDKAFGLALIVRHDAVVTRPDGGVVQPRPHLGALAVSHEVHDIALVPEIAVETSLTEPLVDALEQFDRAGMQCDRPRLPGRAGHAVNASKLDAAPRQLHRQYAPHGAASDDQHRHLARLCHCGPPIPEGSCVHENRSTPVHCNRALDVTFR